MAPAALACPTMVELLIIPVLSSISIEPLNTTYLNVIIHV
jgi:hypothetical protein